MNISSAAFTITLLFNGARAFSEFAPTPLPAYKPTSEEVQRMRAKLTEPDSLLQPLFSCNRVAASSGSLPQHGKT